jgi:GST-like protein
MIDLYALTSPNVQKIFFMLEELELPYRIIPVDVWKGEQFDPNFLKINPNAKVPVIVDHEGPGGRPYTLFESGAILMYLAEKSGRLLPKEVAARYEVIQWLMLQVASIGPIFGQVVHFTRFAPAGNDYAVSRYRTEARRLFELFEKRLGEAAWVGGSDYSIADIAAFPWLRITTLLGIGLDDKPKLKQWVETINARPAIARALEKIAAIKSSRDTATQDNLDRLFGRGRYARA